MKLKKVLLIALTGVLLAGCIPGFDGSKVVTEDTDPVEAIAGEPFSIKKDRVLVNWKGIKVTTLGYDEMDTHEWHEVDFSKVYQGFKVKIENKSKYDIRLEPSSMSINGYTVNDFLKDSASTYVSSGEEGAAKVMAFLEEKLEDIGILNVGRIGVVFNIYNAKTSELLHRTEPLFIRTSNYEKMDTKAAFESQEVYDESNASISAAMVTYHTSFLFTVVENKTNQELIGEVKNITLIDQKGKEVPVPDDRYQLLIAPKSKAIISHVIDYSDGVKFTVELTDKETNEKILEADELFTDFHVDGSRMQLDIETEKAALYEE